MRRIFIICILAILSGCVTGPTKPTPQEIASADYGVPPADYKSQIKNYFSQRLKDPESVRYGQMTEPRKGNTAILNNGVWSNIFGYEVLVFVNAKNSYGGYTGEKAYFFLFRDGKIVHVMP